ncbi:MAG: hypothetical protein AAGG09_01160 [Pseudomonadota bacterium]
MQADLLARLRANLEEERAALRAGQFGRIEELTAQKEKLAAEIGATGIVATAPEIDALRALAKANAALCEAAQSGVRAAIDRFRERTRVAGHLDTYDRSGKRRSFSANPRKAPRRA